jgi:hypothetical protein
VRAEEIDAISFETARALVPKPMEAVNIHITVFAIDKRS